MPSLEVSALALCDTRTFFKICGSGSNMWQTSLTGRPICLTTLMICMAASSPSPVVVKSEKMM